MRCLWTLCLAVACTRPMPPPGFDAFDFATLAGVEPCPASADPPPVPPAPPPCPPTVRGYDRDGDGFQERSVIIFRNPDGTLARLVWGYDEDADGREDHQRRVAYERPEGGGNTVRAGLSWSWYTYEPGTNEVSEERIDDDNDGTIDRVNRLRLVFSELGRIVHRHDEYDDDNDGTPDRTRTALYTDDGELLRIEYDDDADGTVDRTDPPIPPLVDPM